MTGLGKLSTCKRDRVGAIIIPQEMTDVMSIGYNGPPSGEPNESCRNREGDCGCVHAEANAIVKVKSRARDLVMVCSRSPCERCAGLIVNSRAVSAIVYETPYRDSTGLDLVLRAGIVTVRWSEVFEKCPERPLESPETPKIPKPGPGYPG